MSAVRLAPPFLAAASLWSVWAWMWTALTGPGAERISIAALALGPVLFALRLKANSEQWRASSRLMVAASACLTAVAILWGRAPRSLVAVVGVAGLSLAAISLLPESERRRSTGLFFVLVLIVPVIPAMEFVIGSPLRIASGELAAFVLRSGGLEAERLGTGLRLEQQRVFIDPACAGVRLLWTSGFFAAVMAAWHGLRPSRSMMLLGTGAALGLLANGWRTAALAFAELRVPHGISDRMHEAVGLSAFALCAFAVLRLAQRWSDRCAS